GAMTFGGNLPGTLLRGDLDEWTLQATQGRPIALTISESGANTNFSPRLRVRDPSGTLVSDVNGVIWAEADFTPAQSGTYTILASRAHGADGAGGYILTANQFPGPCVVPANDEGCAMTNGGNYIGSLLRGDLDEW